MVDGSLDLSKSNGSRLHVHTSVPRRAPLMRPCLSRLLPMIAAAGPRLEGVCQHELAVQVADAAPHLLSTAHTPSHTSRHSAHDERLETRTLLAAEVAHAGPNSSVTRVVDRLLPPLIKAELAHAEQIALLAAADDAQVHSSAG